MHQVFQVILIFAAALAGGFLAARLRLPGGVIIGAMLSVLLLKYLIATPISMPKNWSFLLQVVVGATVASRFKPEMVEQLQAMALPMLTSAIVLILCGGVLAFLFARFWGVDPVTAYISTSPGAMTALTGMAGGMQVDAFMVLTFHIIRVLLVLLLSPLIIRVCHMLL